MVLNVIFDPASMDIKAIKIWKKGTYYNYHYNKTMLFCFKEILESSTNLCLFFKFKQASFRDVEGLGWVSFLLFVFAIYYKQHN